MADEKVISEREVVKRERKAFANGVACAHRAALHKSNAPAVRFISDGRDPSDIDGIAAREYPMPKIERPRVVSFESNTGGRCYVSLTDGRLRYRYFDDEPPLHDVAKGIESGNESLAADFSQLAIAYVDLIAKPTELVEAPE